MTAAVPLCIHCVHHEMIGTIHVCTKSIYMSDPSPVDGQQDTKGKDFCTFQRTAVRGSKSQCGPSGKFFQDARPEKIIYKKPTQPSTTELPSYPWERPTFNPSSPKLRRSWWRSLLQFFHF
jgi:hypothetical protein